MKKVYFFRLALLSGIAVAFHGCDVMWDTAVDGGDSGFYYGDYPGYGNEWWPILPGSPALQPYPGVNSYYPGYYPPPYSPMPPRPNRPVTRPPQWNGNGEPGPVINIGNVRPGNSGNGNSGNGNQQRPPANVNQGNTRPPFTLTPSRLPDTDNGNNGQRPGRHG